MENKEVVELLKKVLFEIKKPENEFQGICKILGNMINYAYNSGQPYVFYDEFRVILKEEFVNLPSYNCYRLNDERDNQRFFETVQGEGRYHFPNQKSRIDFLEHLIEKYENII